MLSDVLSTALPAFSAVRAASFGIATGPAKGLKCRRNRRKDDKVWQRSCTLLPTANGILVSKTLTVHTDAAGHCHDMQVYAWPTEIINKTAQEDQARQEFDL